MLFPVKFVFRGVLIWLALVFSAGLSAENVEGLYDVSIAVETQLDKDRIQVTRKALAIVFVRVSGDSQILEQAAIQNAISDASSYTKRFSYESRVVGDDTQLYVELEFEATLVDKKLRDAGLPFWSATRPNILLWMVVEDTNGRRFINAEEDGEIFAAISSHATRRGLVLRLPALDLEDTIAVSADDIWRLHSHKAKSAAQRYKANTLLFARATQLTNGKWLGRWLFDSRMNEIEFDGEADTTDQYIGSAFDLVADDLARQYAIEPVDIADNGVIMRLTGVSQFVHYARAIRYLESVSAIRHANVVRISDDEIVIRLVADGSLSQLQQSLALDKKLQPIGSGDYQGAESIDLNFHWPS